MNRTETFCGDRLRREIEQVDVSVSYAGQSYVDGPWRWYLDGAEITEQQANAFRAAWDADHAGAR